MADWNHTSYYSSLPVLPLSPPPHPQPAMTYGVYASQSPGPHSFSSELQSRHAPFGPTMSMQSSEDSMSQSERLTSDDMEVEQKPTRKRTRTNKKAPRAYPLELQALIDQGYIIWGQNIPGILAFDPSRGVGQALHYSVMHLATSESLLVTQMQAFSGRDDEVEEWGSRLAAPPTSSVVVPPTPFWNPRPSPSNPYGRDGTTPVGWNYGPWPEAPRGQRPIVQSSPLLSEAGSLDSTFPSGGCYADDSMTESPPSRASTSFLHPGQSTPFVTTPPTATPEAGPSTHLDTATYPSHFGNVVGFHYPLVTTDVFTPQQTLATPISVMSWPDDPFFGAQAPPQQYLHASRGPFPSAGDPSASFIANLRTGGGYYGGP